MVDNPAFREWALYGRNNLTECDLPHRTKLIEMIFREYEQEHQKALSEFEVSTIFCGVNGCHNDLFQSALGRISFTSDCWSDPNLASFLAITTHFIARKNGSLVLCNKLLAFRIIEGTHDGENLARIVFAILKEAGLLGKVHFAY